MNPTRERRTTTATLSGLLKTFYCVVSTGVIGAIGGIVMLSSAGCGQSDNAATEVPAAETQVAAAEPAPPVQPAAPPVQPATPPVQPAAVPAQPAPGAAAAYVQPDVQAQDGAQPAAPEAPAVGADGDVSEDSTSGFIDMDAVREAFEQATGTDDLEIRINEIYTGEHAILLRIQNVENEQHTEGWEDLDDNGEIDDASDDKLFTLILTRPADAAAPAPAAPAAANTTAVTARVEGHGANSYYTYSYPVTYRPTGAFWTGVLVGNLYRPRYVWVTPSARRAVIINHRRAYRLTPAWTARRAAHRAYYNGVRVRHPAWHPHRVVYSPARVRYRTVRRPRPVIVRPPRVVPRAPVPRPPRVVRPRPPRPRVVRPPRPRPPRPPRPPGRRRR